MSPVLPRGPQDGDETGEEAYEIVEDDESTVGEEDGLFEAEEADEFDPFAQEMGFSEPVMHDRASLEGQEFRDLQAAFAFLQQQGLFAPSDTVRGALRQGSLALGSIILTTRKGATIVLTEEGIKNILGEIDD